MIEFFKNLFTEKAHVPKNSYKDTVPKSIEHGSQVIQYPNAALSSESAFSKTMAAAEVELSAVMAIPVTGDKKVVTNALNIHVAAVAEHALQPDFKNLVATSRLMGQQRAWNEQFQRNTTDMLKKYTSIISEHVKEKKDLESIFKMLNEDLEKLTAPRAPFLKRLVSGLVENKTPFSDSLKAHLQSLSTPAKNLANSSPHVGRINKNRAYCLGSKENKFRA